MMKNDKKNDYKMIKNDSNMIKKWKNEKKRGKLQFSFFLKNFCTTGSKNDEKW